MRKTTVALFDDLDGSPADLTVHFSFKKKEYEIDLTAAHAEEMEHDLAKWIENARRVDVRRPATRSRRGASTGLDLAAVREWARANGFQVSDRGRVPAKVVEAWVAAH